MSDDSKELSRVEDILSGEDYLPKKPMSRVEELLMDGAMVPKVDSTDNGKVLKVIDGEWKPGEDISGDKLPQVDSSDNGKILKVIEGEWNMGDDNDRLPIPGSGDNGKILRIVNGDWQKVTLPKDVQYVQLENSYPFSGNSVNLPEDINDILIANYVGEDILPTYLITSNGVVFTPDTVEVGGTPSNRIVYIYWIRLVHKFNSALQQDDIYEETLYYLTSKNTKTAAYSSQKAIESVPSVDSTDAGKVLQVSNAGKWVSNLLPEVAGVPAVEQADVGKVLKATDVGEYDWGEASGTDEHAVHVPPVIFDNGKIKKIGDLTGFPGIKSVILTPTAYSNLSTDEKEDLSKIYYITDYEFYKSNDEKVIIRFNSDGTEKLIFFNGFVDDFNTVTPYSNFPEELRTIVNNNVTWGTNATILSTNFTADGEARTGNEAYFGIRTTQDWHVNSCNSSGGSYGAKNKENYAVLNMLNNSVYQSNPWSDPYDIPGGYDAIYYGNKQYTDFDIPDPLPSVTSADEGKALIVNSEGEWDKGTIPPSITPVRLSKTAYDALTPAQKADETKLYLIDGSIITDETLISPDDLSADDGKVISAGSSWYGDTNRQPWVAFSGMNATAPYDYVWVLSTNQTPTIGYHFTDSAHKFTKVVLRLVNVTYTAGGQSSTAYVEGSNDGTNWFDISRTSSAQPVSVDDDYTDNELLVDMDKPCSYIRVRFASSINPNANNMLGISAMEIYATETDRVYNAICYNGAEYASLDPTQYRREISQTDYDALPDTKNSDGIIYFITDNS